MPPVVTEQQPAQREATSRPVVNDAVLKIATTNGSGSQSANLIILRSLFRMGVPVSGKNLFPSNIAGLPTWFTIRANENGWLAQSRRIDLLIAMNSDTIAEDLDELGPGAIVIVNDVLKRTIKRDDLIVYPVPFEKLVKEACPDTRLRKRVINVIYVGVLAWLVGIEMDEVYTAIEHQFRGKRKAIDLNSDAARVGYEWASENLEPQAKIRFERTSATDNKIIIEGNEAAALGLLCGGVTVASWYPITPSSSLCENLTTYLDKYRRDPETGKATYAVIQAEDEMASIGVVLGAGWAGARACTATAGPGISLMSEMAGLAYFAEIPAVIVDVQRMGPSTGLPTRTSQADILKAYYLSHGDCRHVLLIPGSVQECYEFSAMALELAETLQTLVFVMSDLDLGMNKWLADPFEVITDYANRGKVLTAEDVEQLDNFQRYADVDHDGIPYRTLPGTDHPKAAYFTRGTGHTTKAVYSERAQDWQSNVERLARKFETARTMVPKPVIDENGDANVAIVAYGSSDPAVEEARYLLKKRYGVDTSYLRVRALPVQNEIVDFIRRYNRVYMVEQNRDAQLATILGGEYPEIGTRMRHVLHYDGMPIDAETIVSQVARQEGLNTERYEHDNG